MGEKEKAAGAVQGTICPNYTACPMFAVFKSNTSSEVFIQIYCKRKFEKCERYQQGKLGKSVPDNMLPNGQSI